MDLSVFANELFILSPEQMSWNRSITYGRGCQTQNVQVGKLHGRKAEGHGQAVDWKNLHGRDGCYDGTCNHQSINDNLQPPSVSVHLLEKKN